MGYLSTDEAYEYNDLACWYQNSIIETQPPIWTDEHLEELLKDFYIIPKDTPPADVVPRSEFNIRQHLLKDAWKRIEELDNLCGELQKARVKVELVRCRDCYYSEEMPGVLGVCLYCNHWCKNVDDGTFCSNGMKIKSEEGKQ